MKFLIVNGPNLNLLGRRNTEIYGNTTLGSLVNDLKEEFPEDEIIIFQSNVEGEIIDKLHEFGFSADGIILNAGGYTHTSVSIADAVEAIDTAVVEVHISNIYAREDFRRKSLIAPFAKGCIVGLGNAVYRLALLSFKEDRESSSAG